MLRKNYCGNGCIQKWLLQKTVVDAGMAAKRDAAENCCEQRISARKLLQKWLHIKMAADAAEKLLRKWLHTKMAAENILQKWLQVN